MHKALPFAFALLGIVLYVLLGRGGEEAAEDAAESPETPLSAVGAGAEPSPLPEPGSAPARPLLESASGSLTGPVAPIPTALPDGPTAQSGVAAGREASRAGGEQIAAVASPPRADRSPARVLGDELGPRGGADPDARCRVGLNRLLLAHGVEDREPIRVDTRFSSDDVPVYVFLDVDNARGPAQDVVVHWDHLGSDHTYEQRISAGASPRWRTWIYHTMRRPLAGNWLVRVTDSAGCTLGEMYFEATEYQGS